MNTRKRPSRIIAILIIAILISECRTVTYAAQMPHSFGTVNAGSEAEGFNMPVLDLRQAMLSANYPYDAYDTTEEDQGGAYPGPSYEDQQDGGETSPYPVPFAPPVVQPVVDLQALLNPLLNQGITNPQYPTAPVEQKPVEPKPIVIPGSVSDSAIVQYTKDDTEKKGSEEDKDSSLSGDKVKTSASENSASKDLKKPVIPAEGAAITKLELQDNGMPVPITKGATIKVDVKVTPESAASGAKLIWSTGDPTIAKVDPNTGYITGVKVGTTTLAVKTEDGVSDTCSIEVTAVMPKEITISISSDPIIIYIGDPATTVTARITPSDVEGDQKKVDWKVVDDSIVKATSNELTCSLTGLKVGKTTLNVKCTNYPLIKASCTVEVREKVKVTGVTLNHKVININVGEYYDDYLEATISPSNATNKSLSWQSNPSGIVSLVSTGYTYRRRVYGSSPGTTTVTVRSQDNTSAYDTCTVNVSAVKVTGIDISPAQVTMGEGETVTGPKVTVYPSNATNKRVNWTIKNTLIATVSPAYTSYSGDGVNVTGVKAGETILVAESADGGYKKECKVIVTPPVAVTGIKLSPDPVTLTAGGSSQTVTATVEPSNATNKNVTWEIEDSTVASITKYSRTCSVRGLKKGKTRLIAKSAADDKIVAYCDVIVNPVEMKVKLDKTAITLEEGSNGTLTATLSPSTVKYKDVKWSVDDGTIVQVSGNGLKCTVTGIKSGTANVTVTVTEDEETDPQVASASCKVTVKRSVTGLEIEPERITIHKGQSFNLTWKVLPEDADNKKVTLSNRNPGIVSATADGKVTGLEVGDAEIVVTTQEGGFSKTCYVTVDWIPVQGVILNTEEITLFEGEERQLKERVYPDDADDKSVSWNSADPGTATVDASGKVKGVKEGDTTVTVTTNDGGKTDTCIVHVIKRGIPVESITVTPSENTIYIGEEFTAVAAVKPDNATDKSISWGSSNPSIATVSADGLNAVIKGVSKGVAVITATAAGGKSAICLVTVKEDWISVTDVDLNTNEITIYEGEKFQLREHIYPKDASDKSVSWNSADPDIASVDENGEVTGVKEGETTVTVTANDHSEGTKTDTCIVHVIKKGIPVESIIVTPSENTIKIGEEFTATATVLPEDATDKKISWGSNNPSIATVSADGFSAVIKGISKGVAVITATAAGGKSAMCVVTVEEDWIKVTDVVLNVEEITLYEGEKYQLREHVLPEDASDKSVSWNSADPDTATVNENGQVTAVKEGTTIVTVRTNDGGKEATCIVHVLKEEIPVESVIVTPSENTITVGQDFNALAVVKPDNATNKSVAWKSNNPAVATVSGNGFEANIKGKAKGVAVITATAGGKTGICVVTVSSMDIPVEDIVLMPMFKEIYEGQWFDVNAEIYPEDATDKSVTWSSSNEKVATVDERGRVTGIKKGEAVIKAVTNDGGHEAECIVTVKENPKPEPAVYNLYIVDSRSSAYRKDLVRGMVDRLEGDRYLVILDSSGAVLKPLINGDSSLKYDKALFYDMWITDAAGYAKNDYGKCTVRIPLDPDMDVKKGTVTVVTVLDNRLDKTVASATGVMDGVNYVTFTPPHFTEYAILYKKNNDSGSTQVIYRDVPVVQYKTETKTVYRDAPAQSAPATQSVPQVTTRILDSVPKTGEAWNSQQTVTAVRPGQFMEKIKEYYGNIR